MQYAEGGGYKPDYSVTEAFSEFFGSWDPIATRGEAGSAHRHGAAFGGGSPSSQV